MTATRNETEIADSAASIAVVDSDQLLSSAPIALDEKLRQLPGLTLFRRSGSRFAHPTAQGVSLRGIGASGASRALVLDDGVPLNDPFGGWIYWSLVPLESIDRVEVLRGGGSDLYGASALGGVIQLVRRTPREDRTLGSVSLGNDETLEASLFASRLERSWRWSAAARAFSTGGYVMVPTEVRGAVDRPAASESTSAELTVGRDLARASWSIRGSWLDESRDNGTPLQVNDTQILRVVAMADWALHDSLLELRAFGGNETFDAAFTALADDRESEELRRLQHVPVEDFGVNANWHAAPRGAHEWLAGADLRVVDGESRETIVLPNNSIPAANGGRQQFAGLYLQDVIRSGRLTATGALRVDWWRNGEGFERSGGGVVEHADASETALSPRASVLWAVTDRIGLAASAYRSFRAPTLNELYRGFRVGEVVTEANPLLEAERLTGIEGGVNLHAGTTAVRARLFWNRIDDPIANVTLRVTPEIIERQRRNLGATRATGLEVDAELHPREDLELRGSVLFSDSEVVDFDADPGLEGNRLPQIPERQWSLSATWRPARNIHLSSQVRGSSGQFEDDRNELTLAAFTVVDLYVSLAVGPRVDAFVAADNLFDERVEIGRTPIPTIGPPRLLRIGIRLR